MSESSMNEYQPKNIMCFQLDVSFIRKFPTNTHNVVYRREERRENCQTTFIAARFESYANLPSVSRGPILQLNVSLSGEKRNIFLHNNVKLYMRSCHRSSSVYK